MTVDDIALEDLPSSARELADLIGIDATYKIVEARGGIRLCVPRIVQNDHWLIPLIGQEAFERLVAYFSGEELDIPMCALALNRARARSLLRSGASVADTARKLGYSERGMRRLKRTLEELGRL